MGEFLPGEYLPLTGPVWCEWWWWCDAERESTRGSAGGWWSDATVVGRDSSSLRRASSPFRRRRRSSLRCMIISYSLLRAGEKLSGPFVFCMQSVTIGTHEHTPRYQD